MPLWLTNGKLAVNATGKPILCDVCPCEVACPECYTCPDTYTVTIPAWSQDWLCQCLGISTKYDIPQQDITGVTTQCADGWNAWFNVNFPLDGTGSYKLYENPDCTGNVIQEGAIDFFGSYKQAVISCIFVTDVRWLLAVTLSVPYLGACPLELDMSFLKIGSQCPGGTYLLTTINGVDVSSQELYAEVAIE